MTAGPPASAQQRGSGFSAALLTFTTVAASHGSLSRPTAPFFQLIRSFFLQKGTQPLRNSPGQDDTVLKNKRSGKPL